MKTKEYLRILKEDIHSAVIATVDGSGRPVTRVIDIMLADEDSLYFLTAKGKAFYEQLMKDPCIAISGMCGGEGTMSRKAVSIRGRAECIGSEKLDEIFEENPYMTKIYPQEESRGALQVFRVSEWTGEFFDLSVKPIFRDSFVLGDGAKEEEKDSRPGEGGYFITDRCRGCRICYSRCPQKCIDLSAKPLVIQQEHCLHCGNCMEVCPFGAVEKR